MKEKSTILVILILLMAVMGAESKNLPALMVNGNVFADEKGNVVRVEGVSIADTDKHEREDQWSRMIFKEAADWGNVVRFPIHPNTWRYRGSKEYLKLLDQGVEWAAKNDMYVIID